MTSAAPRSGWPEHWQDRERAPRRQPLSRERIVGAALRIVDTEGMDALSMRRVGQELGTGAASLYAHVGSKEELVELVLDLAYADIELEEADPARWEEQIKSLLRRSRAALLSHRDLAKAAVVANVPITPHAMDIAEAMLAVLRAAWTRRADRGLRGRPAGPVHHRDRLRGVHPGRGQHRGVHRADPRLLRDHPDRALSDDHLDGRRAHPQRRRRALRVRPGHPGHAASPGRPRAAPESAPVRDGARTRRSPRPRSDGGSSNVFGGIGRCRPDRSRRRPPVAGCAGPARPGRRCTPPARRHRCGPRRGPGGARAAPPSASTGRPARSARSRSGSRRTPR